MRNTLALLVLGKEKKCVHIGSFMLALQAEKFVKLH